MTSPALPPSTRWPSLSFLCHCNPRISSFSSCDAISLVHIFTGKCRRQHHHAAGVPTKNIALGRAFSRWASALYCISHVNDSQLVASFKGDVSSLTAPPFILSSTSLVEYSAYWAGQPALFVQPAKEADSEKRALQVLKWFLSTLHQQYCSRSEKFGSERKPLNPFLGELFIGKWKNEADSDVGDTSLISEQVRWAFSVTH